MNWITSNSTPRTVRIYGTARNLAKAPPAPQGQEVWLTNSKRSWDLRRPASLNEWTRWFNLHSRGWIDKTYPSVIVYWKSEAAGRPLYFQKVQDDLPSSLAFPRLEIQRYFATKKGPNRYFTCSVCWLIALAIMEGFERIELWGFELRDTKPGGTHKFERPCFFYWVQQARSRGIKVTYQAEIDKLPFLPGDPDTYTGKLYGYATKPEPDWVEEY